MSIDLIISIRFLIVLAAQHDRDLLRQASAVGAIPVDVVEAADAAHARVVLAAQDIDVVLLDRTIADDERAAIVEAAKTSRQKPLVVLLAEGSADHAAIAGSLDGLLAVPATPGEAERIVKSCVRARMPGRVLVVDDSSTTRSIVRKILSGSRFALDVFDAAEGIDALRQIAGGNFDLVILDYYMPGLNGLETLSEIKRQYPKVAVIMMSSKQDEELAERARAAGAAAFLWKPFYPADIDVVLRGVYGLRAPPRSSR